MGGRPDPPPRTTAIIGEADDVSVPAATPALPLPLTPPDSEFRLPGGVGGEAVGAEGRLRPRGALLDRPGAEEGGAGRRGGGQAPRLWWAGGRGGWGAGLEIATARDCYSQGLLQPAR